MAEPNIGMDKGELKQLLARSKKEPINCAVAGNTADASTAFILLHKVKAPKAVSMQLDKENPKNFNMRWGTAEVDTDEDPKLVVFRLHKGVTGMAKKLKKTLKGTGYTKVRLEFEDGSPGDADIVDEEGGAAPGAPADTAAAAQPQASATPEAPAAQPNAGAEAAAATQPTAEPSSESTANAGAPAADAAKAASLEKAGHIWFATRKKVHDEVARLKAEIVKVYADNPALGQIEQAYNAKVQPILNAYDVRLVQKLAEAAKAADAPAQTAASGEARKIIVEYATFTGSEPLLKELDANPFAPLAIQQTVTTTLKALGALVH